MRQLNWFFALAFGLLIITAFFSDRIYLEAHSASSACVCFREYVSLNRNEILITTKSHIYLVEKHKVYRVNHAQIHHFGSLLFENPGEIGRVCLDGTREHANYFDSELQVANDAETFQTFEGCRIKIYD